MSNVMDLNTIISERSVVLFNHALGIFLIMYKWSQTYN